MGQSHQKKGKWISFLNLCLLLGWLSLAKPPAVWAQNNTDVHRLLERIERLEANNQALNAELERIDSQSRTFAPIANPTGTRSAGDFENSSILPVNCESPDASPGCSASSLSFMATGKTAGGTDKYPTVKVTGFFQADAFWAHQEPENISAIVNGTPLGDIQDGADFRRARLAAAGDVWKNVGYMIEFDFALPGRPNFMDVYLDIRDLPLGSFRVGQWRQPFGLDALTSVKELAFFERALPFAFLPLRQIGAGLSDHHEDLGLTWANSLFRYPTDPFGGNVGDDGGYGYSGRMTWLMLDGVNHQTLHLGGNYCFADPANDLLRFSNTPELFVGETAGALAPVGVPNNLPPFVDTGFMPSHNFNLCGAELAGTFGSLFAQTEFHLMSVNRIGMPNVTFWGAYAQLSYVLTGEVRPYSKANGVYTRVVPEHPFGSEGWGAWEVAGRWSTIDLTDKDILGNQLQDLTFGLNWYLNKNTKFQFNYIHPMLDSAVSGNSTADLLAVRAQLDF